MSLERCANGHMFNAKRYGSICPYCKAKEKIKDLEARLNHGNPRRDKMIKEDIIEISKNTVFFLH